MREIFALQNPWRKTKNYNFSLRKRDVLSELIKNLDSKKILGIIGSRQVGKSSLIYLLIQHLLERNISSENIFYFNLDNFALRELFARANSLLDFINPGDQKKFIFIDEIQRLQNPGIFLKEIYDLGLNIKIIYSGSSQLEIKSKLKEHLVGRVRQLEIQRLSFADTLAFLSPITKEDALEKSLVFGSYPEVVLSEKQEEKKLNLRDIYQSYIQKDLVEFLHLEDTSSFNKLLILLSHQISSLLNLENICRALKIKRKVLEKYISILEDTFIIKLVYPFHKNYKKEITKTPKIYFLDLGLRNLVIKNFNPLFARDDQGKLFENFFFLELINKDPYSLNSISYWRTTNQTEIDFIVRSENKTKAYEVKWSRSSLPKSFITLKKYYPEIETKLVSRKNFY